MSEVRCNECRTWFDAKEGGCSECGWERPGFNKSLRLGQLNGQLFNMAGNAQKEKNWERAYRSQQAQTQSRQP